MKKPKIFIACDTTDPTKVKKIMQSSSILVVPSIWDDPFPLTALEGLSSGQAVIASDRGGLKEMLKNISKKILKNLCYTPF